MGSDESGGGKKGLARNRTGNLGGNTTQKRNPKGDWPYLGLGMKSGKWASSPPLKDGKGDFRGMIVRKKERHVTKVFLNR